MRWCGLHVAIGMFLDTMQVDWMGEGGSELRDGVSQPACIRFLFLSLERHWLELLRLKRDSQRYLAVYEDPILIISLEDLLVILEMKDQFS